MENNTPTTPTPAPAPAAQQSAAGAPTPAPATPAVQMPDGLTDEQKKAFEALTAAVSQAKQAADAANAKASEPWFWNDFSRGVYVGAGVVLLAVGGVYLYKKYTSSDAE